jgi:toxin-antitoxin system PIN domain toxin
MKRCLVDVNLLLALLVERHEHHRSALRWFDRLAAGEACVCRFVQLALIRLLASRSVMGEHAISASEAWASIDELLGDERVEFAAEPSGVESAMPVFLNQPTPTGKLAGDAYLAAFAVSSGFRMVTMDAGFRNFRELDLELIR